jgi:uncharacterized protein
MKRHRRIAPALAAALLMAASAGPAPAPPAPLPQAAAPEPAGIVLPHGGHKLAAQQVRMRDGVRLNADVYLPAADGKFPILPIRTPYKTEIGRRPDFLNRLLQSGYAIIQQHERGRFLSEGEMRMLGHADEDGWDTLDWIGRQDWSNGKVATYGCSPSAENQLKLASLDGARTA